LYFSFGVISLKILVTGTNGYISKSFAAYSQAEQISLRGEWQKKSFVGYDAIVHAAGLVHQKETRRNQYDYYIVNRDLAFEVAKKAKVEGIGQFVLLSSISVYGLSYGTITADTLPKPTSNYGRSKLAAESLISSLEDENFSVAILRPPMVYGTDCPGNYSRLRTLVKFAPFFPDYENARSVVSIENLCAIILDIVKSRKSGLFFPQDEYPLSTRDMALNIAVEQGKHLRLTRAFNWLLPLFNKSKLFGNLLITIKP